MKKFYRVIIAYNPLENKVTEFRRLDMYSDTYETDSTEMFYKVLGLINRTSDIILGRTATNNFYQLSPTPYGTYIKEDAASVDKFINKSKLLVAIANYQKEKNIPFDR